VVRSVGAFSRWGLRGTMELRKIRMVVRNDFCNLQLQGTHIFSPWGFWWHIQRKKKLWHCSW
jgi:hypothetical protein